MVVSTFYNGSHSGSPTPENPRQNPPPPRLTPAQRDDLIRAAQVWYDAGCAVHPAKSDGSKMPVSVKHGSPDLEPDVFPDKHQHGKLAGMPHPQAGRPNPEAGQHRYGWGRIATGDMPRLTVPQIAAVIRSGRADGIGIFAGLASGGLEMVEAEGRAKDLLPKVRDAAERLGVLHLWQRLVSGCVEESPSGGLHFPFRVTDGPALGNTLLAARPNTVAQHGRDVLFETRGQGGWFVCAPSAGRTHKSGKPYRIIRGGPETIPAFTVAERDALYDAFRSVDEMPPPAPVDPATSATPSAMGRRDRPAGDVLPGDDFNARATWDDVLTGWTRLQTVGDRTYWRRPGKDSGGQSASTTADVLCCFSSSAGLPMFTGKGCKNALSKFSTYTHLHHAGDFTAAARHLWNQGYGSRRQDDDGPDDDAPPAPLEPRPTPSGTCRTLTDWRAEAAARRVDVISQPGLHMDRSPTGSGKTHATVEALRLASTSLTVLPTHANVAEHVQTMRDHGIDAVPFPELTPDTCQQFDVASKAQSLGLVAGAAVCPVCPFKDGCTYRTQTKVAESAAVRVATHERLRRSAAAAEGVRVVVIDEAPETVLAPSLTVNVKQLVPVEQLAHAIKNHWYSTANYDQKAFAGSMLDVLFAVNATCADITSAGAVPVELAAARDVPDNWQKLLFDSIRSVGVDQQLEAEALTLVTKAATGELTSLDIVTDVLPTGRMNHYLVGSWRPAVPADASVILLDATGNPDDIAAVIGRPVNDCTPAGHLPLQHPVVQIDDDISRGTSASTVAGLVEAFLAAHPDVKRVGIIGHKPHMQALMGDDGLLGEPARERVAKWCWFGQGHDRASNDWHQTCDHLLILGTPRTNPGDYRRWLVQHGLRDAAARDVRRGTPEGWGARDWETVTTDGDPKTIRGRGYRDPDWHRAYTAVCRSALQQAVGRCRAIMPDGIPCTILSNEATQYPVAPGLIATPSAVRETVEIIRKMGKPADQPLLAGSAKTPIGNSYRENCASGPWQTGDCLQAIMGAAGIDRRAAQVRLQQCRAAGLLVNPKRGWWGLPGAGDPPVTNGAPKASRPAAAPPPAVVTPPVQAVVISATGPADPCPVVEVAASVDPVTTTTTCTTTVPTSPIPDDTLVLIDERSAIMEYDGGLDRETADRLALEATLGRDVQPFRTAPPDDIVVAVDHAVLAVRSQPFVGQTLRRFSGTVRVIGDRDDPFTTGQLGNRKPRLPGVCSCGHSRWKRLPIHGGDSSRYDCEHCDKFGWYGKWYGDETDDHLPTPPPAAASPGGKVCPVPIVTPSTGGQPVGPVSVGT